MAGEMIVDFGDAEWIWADDQRPNGYVYARKRFHVDPLPHEARLQVAADSRFAIWINGHYAGQGPGVYRRPYVRADSFEIAPYLTHGTNVICVLAHYIGIPTHTYDPGPPGLVCKLRGGSLNVVSDSSWRVLLSRAWARNVPRRTWALGFTEVYDAATAPAGWTDISFDDADWPNATVVDQGALNLLPRITPPLEEFFAPARVLVGAWRASNRPPQIEGTDRPDRPLDAEVLQPMLSADRPVLGENASFTVQPPDDGGGVAVTLDMGEELSGQIEIAMTSPKGVHVDLCMAELLRDDGRAWCHRKDNLCMLQYISRAGRQEWRNYHWSAGRYLHLVFRNPSGPVTIHRVGVWRRQARLDFKASFKCNDEVLNRIWRIGCHTLHISTQDTSVDCPTREQAPYWGDAVWVALWTAWLTGDASYLKHLMLSAPQLQMADGQLPDSLFTGFGEQASRDNASWSSHRRPIIFDYTLTMVIGLWEHFWLTGDSETVATVLPAAERALDWYRTRIGPTGLVELDCAAMQKADQGILFVDHPGLGWHNTPDNRPGIDRSGISAALNAFYVLALRAAAKLHHHLENSLRAAELNAEADALAGKMHAAFWRDGRSAYVDAVGGDESREQLSQQTNVLMVLAAVCPADRRADVIRTALDESDASLCLAGPYFWAHIAETLCGAGLHGLALSHIRTLWGAMADAGATTWWETFLGDELDSLCHAWSSAPNYLFLKEIVGIRPSRPAFAALELRPRIDLLQRVESSMPLPGGEMRVRWERKAPDRTHLVCHVAGSQPVNLVLPEGWRFEGAQGASRSFQGPCEIELVAVHAPQ